MELDKKASVIGKKAEFKKHMGWILEQDLDLVTNFLDEWKSSTLEEKLRFSTTYLGKDVECVDPKSILATLQSYAERQTPSPLVGKWTKDFKPLSVTKKEGFVTVVGISTFYANAMESFKVLHTETDLWLEGDIISHAYKQLVDPQDNGLPYYRFEGFVTPYAPSITHFSIECIDKIFDNLSVAEELTHEYNPKSPVSFWFVLGDSACDFLFSLVDLQTSEGIYFINQLISRLCSSNLYADDEGYVFRYLNSKHRNTETAIIKVGSGYQKAPADHGIYKRKRLMENLMK